MVRTSLGAVVLGAAEVDERLPVVVEELDAVAAAERVPAEVLRNPALGPGLLGHLEEEEVRQLGDVLVVGDAVVAEDVAELPELRDDVVGRRAAHRRRMGGTNAEAWEGECTERRGTSRAGLAARWGSVRRAPDRVRN